MTWTNGNRRGPRTRSEIRSARRTGGVRVPRTVGRRVARAPPRAHRGRVSRGDHRRVSCGGRGIGYRRQRRIYGIDRCGRERNVDRRRDRCRDYEREVRGGRPGRPPATSTRKWEPRWRAARQPAAPFSSGSVGNGYDTASRCEASPAWWAPFPRADKRADHQRLPQRLHHKMPAMPTMMAVGTPTAIGDVSTGRKLYIENQCSYTIWTLGGNPGCSRRGPSRAVPERPSSVDHEHFPAAFRGASGRGPGCNAGGQNCTQTGNDTLAEVYADRRHGLGLVRRDQPGYDGFTIPVRNPFQLSAPWTMGPEAMYPAGRSTK